MLKLLLFIIIVTDIFFMSAFMPLVFAQGPEEEREDEIAAAEEMLDSMQGTVMSISPALRVIVLKGEEDSEIYEMSVKRNATFYGEDSLSDIEPGDMIRVDYYTFNDKRIVTNIVMEERVSKEETRPTLGKVLGAD